MDTLKNILQKALGTRRLTEALQLAELKANWAAGLGNIQPVNYKNKVLFLAAESAAAAHHARLAQQTIISEYKKLCPHIEIKEIKIQNHRDKNASEIESVKGAAICRPCPSCGRKYSGEGSVCIFCLNERSKKMDTEIRHYLDEAPWARYRDIRQTLPHISEERFEKVLCDLREETLFWLWRSPDETAAIKYIMLKTGFTPDKINDNIIKEHLPKKLHGLMALEGKNGRIAQV